MTEPHRAAVLVALHPEGDGDAVVLTRRAEHLPTHAGQIAFPGGRHEVGRDESLLATALREADEEIGLDPRHVEVLGALPTITTMSSGFEIHPFVGRIPPHYRFRPHAGEVIEVFSMPLRAYADPALRVTHSWSVQGRPVEVPAIAFEGRLVWGATLRILDLLQASLLV